MFKTFWNKNHFIVPDNKTFVLNNQQFFIEYEIDIEYENKGFLLHQLNIKNNKKQLVGYIKINYIPEESWNYYYPTILNYLSDFRNYSFYITKLNFQKDRYPEYVETVDEIKEKNILIKLINTLYIHTLAYTLYLEKSKLLENFSFKELQKELKWIIKKTEKKHLHKFKKKARYFNTVMNSLFNLKINYYIINNYNKV